MLVSKVLATDANTRGDFGRLSDDFQVVFSGFRVSHTYDVPAEVVTFVCAQSWTPRANRDPVWAFCSHVVVTEACDVSVHFGVGFSNDS